MTAWIESGFVPNVVGISADSTTPRRPLVPAPTKMTRPPFRNASTMMSAPIAMRGFSRCTAASTLRSSLIISSMMSADEALSMPSVAGLMASVVSCWYFERWGIGYEETLAQRRAGCYPQVSIVSTAHDLVDAYLTHLRVERRLADNTVESYSRDLQRLGEFCAAVGKPVQGLDRRDLARFVDGLM